jgi:hypothetical protein
VPYKNFTSTTLGQSDVDTYLMEQAVIRTTTSARPAVVNVGMMTACTDVERYEYANGSLNWIRGDAWTKDGMTGAQGTFGAVAAAQGATAALGPTVTFDSEASTGGSSFSGSNYVAPVAGVYVITVQVLLASSIAFAEFFARINIASVRTFDLAGSCASAQASGTVAYRLNSGDLINFAVYQNAVSTINTQSTSGFEIWRIPGSA